MIMYIYKFLVVVWFFFYKLEDYVVRYFRVKLEIRNFNFDKYIWNKIVIEGFGCCFCILCINYEVNNK